MSDQEKPLRGRATIRVCVLMTALLIGPVSRPSASQPDIRVSTELVVLHVSVRDRDRQPLPGLSCDSFLVYEDNRPQSLSFCERGNLPLVLGLVVDSSTSMGRYRDLLAAAGESFVRLGNAENDVFLLRFNEHVRNALPGIDFTSDAAMVGAAVRSIPARGMTALHDAIDSAIAWTERSDRLKKVVVLVADGGDNASELKFTEVLQRALRGNVAFFAVSLGSRSSADADPRKLERLARETGGLVFDSWHERDVVAAFEEIAADLSTGYTLAYVSNNAPVPGQYRRIRVSVGSARAIVRTRAGYVTTGESHGASKP